MQYRGKREHNRQGYKAGIIECYCHDIRSYSVDKHRRVDDSPYGGGNGMVMQPMPIYACYEDVCGKLGVKPHVIYMSPQGAKLTQSRAVELSKLPNIFILCGHYEGVDERILEKIVDEEVSIGDYVLTGGELPALVLVDSVARMCDGVLANEECYTQESHYAGLLEYPQYTRPPEWEGSEVPEVLLSGHHANIEKWRRQQMLTRTYTRRPDMLKDAELTKKDLEFLRALKQELAEKDS